MTWCNTGASCCVELLSLEPGIVGSLTLENPEALKGSPGRTFSGMFPIKLSLCGFWMKSQRVSLKEALEGLMGSQWWIQDETVPEDICSSRWFQIKTSKVSKLKTVRPSPGFFAAPLVLRESSTCTTASAHCCLLKFSLKTSAALIRCERLLSDRNPN